MSTQSVWAATVEVGHTIKPALDAASVGVILGTLVGYLPALAAGLSIVWYAILIYGKVAAWRRTKVRARRRR